MRGVKGGHSRAAQVTTATGPGGVGRQRDGARAGVKEPPPPPLLMVAAFAAVYIIWGSTYLGIKYAIETLPPLTMAGARFLIAGTVLYGWARWFAPSRKAAERERLLAAHWRTAAIVGVLLFL